MVGKHIFIVGNPSIVASGALNMIKDIHGTQEVRYADSIPNDTRELEQVAVVVIEDSHSKINNFQFVEFENSCELRKPMNRKERRHGFVENNEPWRNKKRGG